MRKIYLAGIKPTGIVHIGNYFGFLSQFKKKAENNPGDTFILYIADIHGIVSKIYDGKNDALKFFTKRLFFDLHIIFKELDNVYIVLQSWIINICSLSFLLTDFKSLNEIFMFHAYKKYKKEKKYLNFSILSYPFLMAADILCFDTNFLVVSYDQMQHLEITKDIAYKFNSQYGEHFIIPKIHDENLLHKSNLLYAHDGRKMSKSNNNCLNLFSTDEEIEKYIMSIKTSSKVVLNDDINECNNLLWFLLHKLDLDMFNKIKDNLIDLGYEQIKKHLIKKFKIFSNELNRNENLNFSDEAANEIINYHKRKSQFIVDNAIKKINKILYIFFYK